MEVPMGFLQDATWGALERSLDAAAIRQRAMAQNLANIDTPGYKRSVVRFEEALARALDTPGNPDERARKVSSVTPRVERIETSLRADGNNVDIDLEGAMMAENALHYEAVSRMTSARVRLLRTAITEGRR
jgi:flagellar basal-body rod protein FlgB